MDRIAALAKSCRIAKVLDPVLNSECAFTFHSPYTSEKGIVVSLTTFVGTVEELGLNGSDEGEEGLFVRIAKRRVEKYNGEERADGGGDEAPQTVIKLGVGVEGTKHKTLSLKHKTYNIAQSWVHAISLLWRFAPSESALSTCYPCEVT